MRLPLQGESFKRNGSEYEIVYASIDRVRFSDLRSHNIRTETLDDFVDFIQSAKGKVEHPFLGEPESLLGAFTKKEQQIMMERYELILYVESRATRMASKLLVEPLLKEFAEKNNIKSYSFQTFYRLYSLFIKERNITSLLPKTKKRGQKKKVYSEDIEDLIQENLNNVYLNKQRYSAQHCYDILEADYNTLFGSLPLKKRPEFISRSGYYRRVNDLDQYTVTEMREGKTKANKLFRCKGITEELSRALERVEVDGNYLDLHIVDPSTGEILGRPRLTVFIDVITRCILSFELSINGFSAASLLRAFKAALTTKNDMPGGRIEKLYIDNGSDYISESFQNACSSLKIQVHHLAPRTPNAKSHVERFFRTLNENLIHRLKGTTFSNPQQKGEDYNSEELARLTLEEVREQIEGYIHNRYHITPHRITKRAPIELWDELNEEDQVNQLSAKNVDTVCRLVQTRMINNSRVTYKGLYFTSASLADIDYRQKRRRRDARVEQGVEIYIDESDLSYVLVRALDIPNAPFVRAVSTRPNYTKNLSVFEHKLITEALNKAGQRDLEKHSEERLKWVREHIRTSLAQETTKKSLRQSAQLPALEEEISELISQPMPVALSPLSGEETISVKQPVADETNDEIVIDAFASEDMDMNSKGAAFEK
jgi:putative transposase